MAEHSGTHLSAELHGEAQVGIMVQVGSGTKQDSVSKNNKYKKDGRSGSHGTEPAQTTSSIA
jgi:hypothetical protein